MNFKLLDEIMDDFDESIYDILDNLSNKDIEELKDEINGWNQELVGAHDLLADYAGIVITNNDMREILKKNIKSAYELFTKSLRDTCVRDIFIDEVLHHFGIGNMPCYGDSQEYKEEWKKKIQEAVATNKFKVLKEND